MTHHAKAGESGSVCIEATNITNACITHGRNYSECKLEASHAALEQRVKELEGALVKIKYGPTHADYELWQKQAAEIASAALGGGK